MIALGASALALFRFWPEPEAVAPSPRIAEVVATAPVESAPVERRRSRSDDAVEVPAELPDADPPDPQEFEPRTLAPQEIPEPVASKPPSVPEGSPPAPSRKPSSAPNRPRANVAKGAIDGDDSPGVAGRSSGVGGARPSDGSLAVIGAQRSQLLGAAGEAAQKAAEAASGGDVAQLGPPDRRPPDDDPGPTAGRRVKQAPEDDDPDPATTAIVRMTALPGSVEVGQNLSLLVQITDASNVGHVPFHVSYDPAVLEFSYGVEGPFLGSDGNGTVFIAATTDTADEVVVGLSRLGRVPGVAGGGELCVLHFTAVGPGDARLGFVRASVKDSSARVVPAVFQPASLSVR